jgi:DNA primase
MLYDLETLKSQHPLADVAARYVQLRRSGAHLVGRCPFHEERTPSFTINPARQRYCCYGCGRSGDVIAFVQQIEGLSFRDAVRRLGGAALSTRTSRPHPTSRPAPAPHEQPHILTAQEAEALDVAIGWWHETLLHHDRALSYLSERGVDCATIEKEQIGYAGRDVWLPLRWYPRSYLEAAYRLGIIDRCGHDRFAGRVILPELRSGRPIWLTGRLLEPQTPGWGTERKYLTVRGIARPLLGYEAAAAAQAPREGGILVCEGPFDRLAAVGWGYSAVALGSAWPSPRARQELRTLLAGKHRGYLVPDGDAAGQRGMLTLLDQLDLPPTLCPAIVRLPLEIKDLGELAAHPDGQAILTGRLAEAFHARQTWPSRTADHTARQADRSLTPAGLP